MLSAELDVLVVGAGIGGLSAALSLHAAGFTNVRVAESAADLRPLGVGLNLLPNAVGELASLDLLDDLAVGAIATEELAFYNRYGQQIWREPRGRAAGYRWPQLSLSRRHLQAVLMRAARARLGDTALIVGAHIDSLAQLADGGVRVSLRDGRSLDAALVIGADGVHSRVRAAMFPSEGPPSSHGMVMWRGTTWARPYLTGRSMTVIGDDVQRLVCYPVAPHLTRDDCVLINWVAARPDLTSQAQPARWDHAAPSARVLQHFADWRVDWLDIPSLLARVGEVYEYPMIDREPLPRWSTGCVTLLGDAAHAMVPNGSNGATQAIMDARALAYCLHCSADLQEALARYERERRPSTTQLQARNRARGPEAVITLAHQRAPAGFIDVREVLSQEELRRCADDYAAIGGFDVGTVNAGSRYCTGASRRLQEVAS